MRRAIKGVYYEPKSRISMRSLGIVILSTLRFYSRFYFHKKNAKDYFERIDLKKYQSSW